MVPERYPRVPRWRRKTLEFLAGYLIEQSLSMDNIVFVMIFGYFAVPPELQRRVLLYGVLGAIVMRAGMILAGVWLVTQFAWMLYVFGAFLVITGIKMLIFAEAEPDLEAESAPALAARPPAHHPQLPWRSFFVRQNGVLWATPMFLVLVLIEASDVVFAVDSIPAIFAVTTDPFIVFTSNIFAIMGLRALYFLLADMADRFHLLKYGLAIVLVFIGGKMLAMPWFHMPIQWSLAIVAASSPCRSSPALPCRNPDLPPPEKKHEPRASTPVLAGNDHDSDGRLVGLVFDSTPPLEAPDINPWLVAVDSSDNALRAVAYAAAQAGEMNACALHLVHVQPWLSKEAAAAELAHRALGRHRAGA